VAERYEWMAGDSNWLLVKQVLPEVIWEECVALAQLCNKVPIGYNGTF